MNRNALSPGDARHHRRALRPRRSVLVPGLSLAGPALMAHGLIAGRPSGAVLVATGSALLLLAAVLVRIRARHDPATIRLMERRNEEAFATYWT